MPGLKPRKKMVHPEGVEPPTYRFVVCCSIQLSYGYPSKMLLRNSETIIQER